MTIRYFHDSKFVLHTTWLSNKCIYLFHSAPSGHKRNGYLAIAATCYLTLRQWAFSPDVQCIKGWKLGVIAGIRGQSASSIVLSHAWRCEITHRADPAQRLAGVIRRLIWKATRIMPKDLLKFKETGNWRLIIMQVKITMEPCSFVFRARQPWKCIRNEFDSTP